MCVRLSRVEEPEPGAEVRVWGNMVAFVERLDDEHFKSLQARPVNPFRVALGFSGRAFAERGRGLCRELALSAVIDWWARGLRACVSCVQVISLDPWVSPVVRR